MKKLIFITLMMCLWTFISMAQVATNKIVNTATIYSSNSPITTAGIINAQSNLFVGAVFEAGTNALGGGVVGTHFMIDNNPGNPVLVLRNVNANGLSGFYSKDSLGNDTGFVGFENNTSNFFLRSFMGDDRRVQIDIISGGLANTLYLQRGGTTNTGPFVAGSLSSTNYMVNGVRGLSFSDTNVFGGVTNVKVFGEGIVTNKFTLP